MAVPRKGDFAETGMKATVQIFYSYAHEDEDFLKELKAHLASLQARGLIHGWHDRMIGPGRDWKNAIDQHLGQSDLIVLLVSSDFINSSYCYSEELSQALRMHSEGRARAVPVIVRHCVWEPTRLGALQVLPQGGSPVASLSPPRRDELWMQVVNGIGHVISDLAAQRLYDDLAQEGSRALASGEVSVDSHIGKLASDNRRGLTLIARLSEAAASSIEEVLADLKQAGADLFCYNQDRLHFSILSLVPASEAFDSSTFDRGAYTRCLRPVLGRFGAFALELRGVCATRTGVIAKGFPCDHTLDAIRDAAREALRVAGLGDQVDKRYRLRGAHVTIARYTRKADFEPLCARLNRQTERALGCVEVSSLELVVNDFFLSRDKVEIVEVFHLGTAGTTQPREIEKPPAPAPCRHNLPLRPTHVFGRDAEHKHLSHLARESQHPIVVISGHGGAGKSTLAKLAGWSSTEGVDAFGLVVWIDVRQYDEVYQVSLDSVLGSIAKVAEPHGDVPTIADMAEKTRRVIDLLRRQRSLLIVDNYESLLTVPSEEQSVCRFLGSLPIGSAGTDGTADCIRVLITTREISQDMRKLPHKVIELEGLGQRDSLAMMKAAGTRGPKLRRSDYAWIWDFTLGLPRYMEVALSSLERMTFADWQHRVRHVAGRPGPGSLFFDKLFERLWETFSPGLKNILLAMTHFVGEAMPAALRVTSGLSEDLFAQELERAATTDVASTGAGYTVHPLTHAWCRGELKEPRHDSFRDASSRRFVRYFVEFASLRAKDHDGAALEREIRNILAACRRAEELAMWAEVIELREACAPSFRNRGYWHEQRELTVVSVEACRKLGDRRRLARYLALDLGWLALRFEDVDEAEARVKEGLEIFRQLRDVDGIAHATRHLGKAALLRGLDERYEPNADWDQHAPIAEGLYRKSLRLRQALRKSDETQRVKIADLELDLGRLCWLQGSKMEHDARTHGDTDLLDRALGKYQDANKVTWEAMDVFLAEKSDRGVAKSWGNLGNATKAIARFLEREGKTENALARMSDAHMQYNESLNRAEKIRRKDEISHALWGLAEVHEFLAEHAEPGKTADLRATALRYAEKAHRLYRELGGPRDICVTSQLVARLRNRPPGHREDRDVGENSPKTSCDH